MNKLGLLNNLRCIDFIFIFRSFDDQEYVFMLVEFLTGGCVFISVQILDVVFELEVYSHGMFMLCNFCRCNCSVLEIVAQEQKIIVFSERFQYSVGGKFG